MTQPGQLMRPMVGRGAGLDANQARRQLLEERQDTGPAQLAPDHYSAFIVNPVDLENVLRKIKTDRGNFHLGRLPYWRLLDNLHGTLRCRRWSRPLHQKQT
jgi:hypothetical protein